MDGAPTRPITARRWLAHAGHAATPRPHGVAGRRRPVLEGARSMASAGSKLITLDGSHGEGGGQILRSALSLSMLTGRPFRIVKIRANRDQPGLRPQHLAAVEASALLCDAEVTGGAVGSRDLTFRPGPVRPRDLDYAIGTAGSTAMVLQTLHLPIALRAESPVRVAVTGGTFNTKAPSYPFLDACWRRHLAEIGLTVDLTMPAAGFYPRGAGRVEATIRPATPRALTRTGRGPLIAIRGVSGVCQLHRHKVAERMRDHAASLLEDLSDDVRIDPIDWPGPFPGAAIALTAEYEGGFATFVGLGERGKPAEAVAEGAVTELLEHHDGHGAVDFHSADQLQLPLAFAEGRSEYTVSAVTEHLRTNARTIAAFVDRTIRIDEPGEAGEPGRVVVE